MRQIKYLIKSDKAIYSGLFLIAFVVVFSSTFNPLNFREMHVDTSVYITISKGIINGLLPYKDLVDNKGPLMYLMSVPGLFFGGFTGVWITELILMCISVLFAYKAALFFADKYKAFMGTVFCFIILLAFFTVNAGTEEYSLPFLMISFYLFIKYYFSEKREIRFYESIILGICFAWVTMIRLNMFSLWTVFCLMIFIESVIKRRFALLGKYILGFLLGIIAVFTPVFFYLKLNGILNEFILQVIFAGSLRGFSGANIKETIKSFYYVINLTYSFVPLFIGLYWIIAEFKQKNLFFYLGYIFTYILFILFFSISPGGKHYNMVLIPFFIPAIISLIDILYSLFSDEKIKKIIILFLLFLAFTNEGFGKYFWTLSRMFIGSTGLYLFSTGKIIDENTKMDDKIISLGFNGYIYPFTRRGSVSKYFYQGSGLNQIPGAKEEFLSDVLINKPAMIVIYTGPYMNEEYMDDWHAPIYKMMDNEYYLFSKNVLFKLYKRND